MRERNQRAAPHQSLDLRREMDTAIRRTTAVSTEEHVTNRLEMLLGILSSEGLCGDIEFPQRNQVIFAAPDIIAMRRDNEALGVGPIIQYRSPKKGSRAKIQRENVNTVRSRYILMSPANFLGKWLPTNVDMEFCMYTKPLYSSCGPNQE